MYFDLEKARLIPVPDELTKMEEIKINDEHELSDKKEGKSPKKVVETADEVEFHLNDEEEKEDKNKLPKYYYVPFIIYMILSIIILFCFLIRVNNTTTTLIYFLIQSLFVIAIGCIIYWMSLNGAVSWTWIVLIIALIIQIVWVTMVIYYA